MTLTGPQIGELAEILCTAFDRSELEQLVRVSTNIDLFAEVAGPNEPARAVAFQLITALERRSITPTLLDGALKCRAKNERLVAFCRHCAPELLAPIPAARQNVSAAVAGLVALRDRLADPLVRAQVNASRANLQQIGGLTERMQIYKGLHDGLHMVQVQFYRQVIEAARQFRTDPTAADILDGYVAGLQALAAQAHATAAGLPADATDARGQELKWVKVFETEAVNGLRVALDSGDALPAQKAAVRLKSLLVTEPPRINQRLTETATQLPLDQLIATLAQVLAPLAPDDPASQPLRDGLAGLRQLYPRLMGQIAQHTQWQRVEKELWQADENLHQTSDEARDEFAFCWPAMRAEAQALADLDCQADWVAELTRYAAALDAALAANNPAKVRDAFARYRRRAMFRFFEVDLALKELCGTVAALGEPVNHLLSEALQ